MCLPTSERQCIVTKQGKTLLTIVFLCQSCLVLNHEIHKICDIMGPTRPEWKTGNSGETQEKAVNTDTDFENVTAVN